MGRDLNAPQSSSASAPAPFEITQAGAALVACNGSATMQVNTAEGARLVRRRARKLNTATGASGAVEWAMAELDGVRVYFDGANVVVTRRDLMP